MPTTPSAPRRASRSRQRLAAALVAVVVGVGASVLPALGAVDSPVAAVLGSSCAEAAGTVRVGLVIDFGSVDGAGSAHAPVRGCVTTGDRGTGFDVLADAGHTYRVNGSGLLCAIDGYPASGCGDRTATGYRYWSYWHGGTSWTYSSVGPGGSRPHDGGVEGWHYVEGGGNPTDPPPGSSPASPCPASPPPTNAPPTGGGGDSAGATVPPGSGSGAARPGGATGSASTTVAGPADGAATDPADATPSTEPDLTGGTAPTGAAGPGGVDGEVALDASTAASSGRGSSGLPVGVVVVLVAVVLLGVSAAVRFRLRGEG